MIARLAYGALFVAVLPALAVLWARRLDVLLSLPRYGSLAIGIPTALIGVVLMALAIRDLRVHGGGLPASPFPPERLVVRGVYRYFAHPIYLGAVLVSVGVSLAARSAGGLWVVTPALALACAAFVLGFERDATRLRFGRAPEPLFRLAPDTADTPTAWDRASVYVLVFVPWLVLYEAVEYLGVPADARSAYSPWEANLPVVPWTEAIYFATYPFVLAAPLAARRRSDLGRFAVGGLVATAVIMPIYLLVPLVAAAKPVAGAGFWEEILRWERQGDRSVTAFPAFHVVWSCLAARLYAARWPRLRAVWWTVVAGITVSCLTTGMHAVVDVLGGFAAYALVARAPTIWQRVRAGAERVANSWAEARAGPIRLLSHGVYAAVGAVVGLGISVMLAGKSSLGWLLAMAGASIVGALLWAQFVEGSPELLRPYGYFGALVGTVAVAVGASAAGADGWGILAAFGVGAAFSQAIGRMRCLVQGCCHGREGPVSVGIRYVHSRSRVVRLSGLGGVPLHPTPVYSMAWMTLVGLVLLRLWMLGAPAPFVAGCYFLLTGLGRFVEESFRGEPQTAVVAGLRLYQWLAIVLVVGGAAVTAFGARSVRPPGPLEPAALPVLAAFGLMTYAAYGLDFPKSSRRFSRLT
ncbi:MAG: prolipoprotein diacylglyceryl transferase family protein [Acidobacteriota bacterium]